MVVTVSITSLATGIGIDTNSTSLPPAGIYTSPLVVHGTYPSIYGPIVLSNIALQPLQPVDRELVNGGQDEIQSFDGLISGDFEVGGLEIPGQSAIGPLTVIVYGYGVSQTGVFATEITSLLLSAPDFGGLLLRESPTLPSTGQTTITPIGGGMFHIESFFDVFTELSLDGGATWSPDTSGPAHIVLTSAVPEPSTMALAGIGALGLLACGLGRRRLSR
jgi:hypothetical protein